VTLGLFYARTAVWPSVLGLHALKEWTWRCSADMLTVDHLFPGRAADLPTAFSLSLSLSLSLHLKKGDASAAVPVVNLIILIRPTFHSSTCQNNSRKTFISK
jgi:hypothetical protein